MSGGESSRGTLFIVSAPSGAGKTSLVNALVERLPTISLSVSHTTRPIRPGETDRVHYHFVDDAVFDSMVTRDAFLEHADVFGHRYGTALAPVEERLAAGEDVILEIDWQGARQVRAAVPEAVGIFVLPPSRETLLERLRSRGKDSDAVIEGRMAAADEEMSHQDEFDYQVVNDDFDTALEALGLIVLGRRRSDSSGGSVGSGGQSQ
jgi:guanylate kinase